MGFAGIDEEEQTAEEVSEVTGKAKRKPFALWTVGSEDYRLRLKADMICKLEDKYRTNILNLITDSGIPPLAVMLTIIQAAMIPFNHGIKVKDVQKMYELFLDEGGSQMKLLTSVIFPIMSVSGFFTESQSEDLAERMKEMDSEI